MDYLREFQGLVDTEFLKNSLVNKDIELALPVNTDLFESLKELPQIKDALLSGPGSVVELLGTTSKVEREKIKEVAEKLMPWRKGPFDFFGMEIDAEWRSDHKWDRLVPHLPSLFDKVILDIGCNNGYFMYRMLEHDPKLVLGIDPVIRTYIQFLFTHHFADDPRLKYELFGVDQVEAFSEYFDVIFSMGIIYHHKNPMKQLDDMRRALRPGGTLVLETIGIPGDESVALFPEGRYAQMRNVWFVPTFECLKSWLTRMKFVDIELISSVPTTTSEQRVTKWSGGVSLDDFLDQTDSTKTIEGHPAPQRICVKAKRK
ncbi:MAG: tRNA 5-methoxyuridine(34)/uridine 5-oxyacetic acid(34) synthase CmoB [Bacteriovoracaceae bacterium]|jgi:tRNA (mo5U34)-methyltransferase|nr:tRNA 5-methoxyuridine(34)/uridine 5-oxyacetic acid(34) synthase CmoB [Bacteriovoracaceae bacterium]